MVTRSINVSKNKRYAKVDRKHGGLLQNNELMVKRVAPIRLSNQEVSYFSSPQQSNFGLNTASLVGKMHTAQNKMRVDKSNSSSLDRDKFLNNSINFKNNNVVKQAR